MMAHEMIGYFVLAGDFNAAEPFDLYERSFAKLVKQRMGNRHYGSDLDLILVQYHVEGKFLPQPTKEYRVGGFRKKEKSIGVVVWVARSFKDKLEAEKRQFIVDTTLEVIRLVRTKMDRLGYKNIDFDTLTADVRKCADEYMVLDGDLAKFAWLDTQNH